MHADHTQATGALDQAASVFVGVRPQLFGIAYRMLGAATEAEDIVHEAWLRRQATDRAAVNEPLALPQARLAARSDMRRALASSGLKAGIATRAMASASTTRSRGIMSAAGSVRIVELGVFIGVARVW